MNRRSRAGHAGIGFWEGPSVGAAALTNRSSQNAITHATSQAAAAQIASLVFRREVLVLIVSRNIRFRILVAAGF